jgi:N-sulfoglucosamine sulfohydrolase
MKFFAPKLFQNGIAAIVVLLSFSLPLWSDVSRMNLLIITADDMNYDSVGCMGNPLPGITPHIDRLAKEGVLFTQCYNTSTICGPSRASLMTGMHPQTNGYMGHGKQPPGFWKASHPDYRAPSMTTLLRDAGYFTAMLDKTASQSCKWDMLRGHHHTHGGRDPQRFYELTKEAIERAQAEGKPFFVNANPTDPHRYWAGHPSESEDWVASQVKGQTYTPYPNGKPYPDPEQRYTAEEVPLPACFPDEKVLREKIQYYYGSVNRLDMNVGAILKALEETGAAENTLIVFLSDHGMGWSFAKWTLYPYGTRTPLILHYPGKLPAGQVDDRHVISTVDVAPTLLTLLGMQPHPEMDGFSFSALLTGEKQNWPREEAPAFFGYLNLHPSAYEESQTWRPDFAERNVQYRPMRSLNSREYVYVWNGWSNGNNEVPRTMGNGDEVIHFLEKQSSNESYAARAEFYKKRVPEELYAVQKDPGCRVNLSNDPAYQKVISGFRNRMVTFMQTTADAELQNYSTFIHTLKK